MLAKKGAKKAVNMVCPRCAEEERDWSLDEVHDLDILLHGLVNVGDPPLHQVVVVLAGPVRRQMGVVGRRWVGHRPVEKKDG